MAVPNPSATAVDMVTCESEAIHIPGTILPHGAMLVLDSDTLKVLQAAGDTLNLLGSPLAGLDVADAHKWHRQRACIWEATTYAAAGSK